jgi:hypothetical protein
MPQQPEIERLRQRLNTFVLVIAGQFLGLVAWYWLRFVPAFRPFDFNAPTPPPSLLLVCAGVIVLPFLLPPSYFRPRPFERALYRRLGIRWFRAIATDGDFIMRRLRARDPTFRVIGRERSASDYAKNSILGERWHTSWLLLGLITAGLAVANGEYIFGAVITVFNLAFNFYPVLLQRYHRIRLRRPLPWAR